MSSDVALGDTVGSGAPAGEGALAVGARLGGRYTIQGFLGRGGMGAVYLALDEALGKQVALKVVGTKLAGSTGAVARLRDEVLLAQEVTHANVCRTYDLEEVDGQWLVKMEYVAGETLSVRLARGRLDVDEALRVARAIADGLAAAHANGVVHRDLKPQNVMIEDGTGRVVLMDFGIARTVEHAGQTADGISGTPEYMSPEQARGREVDARADVYSLGCVLHHMLTGQVVFPASNAMAAALRHIEDPPPGVGKARPETPAWLANAIARMLEKDPGKRPADARAALAGPARRAHSSRAAILAVAALAALAVALVVWRPWRAHAPPWRARVAQLLPAYDENADATMISPDGTHIAYVSDRERTGTFRLYLEPAGGGASRALTPPDLNVLLSGWQRDGRALHVATLAAPLTSYLVPLDGGPMQKVADRAFVQACGDGLLVVEIAPGDCVDCVSLLLRDAGGGERRLKTFPAGQYVYNPSCDATGQRIVYGMTTHAADMIVPPGDLWLLPTGGGPERRLTADEKQNTGPRFTASGGSVVFSSARGGKINLWELSLAGGEPRQLTFGEGPDIFPFPAADDRTLVFNIDATAEPLFAYPLAGGPRRRVTPRMALLDTPSATPDGREVMVARRDGGAKGLAAISLADGNERQLVDVGESPAVSPDGRDVVYVVRGQPARLMAIAPGGGAPRLLAELDGLVFGPVVDGERRVHFRFDRGDSAQAWSVPLDGGAAGREADAPWCRVLPAPAGGWRAFQDCRGSPSEFRLVPPGGNPDDASARKVLARQVIWGSGGAWLLAYDTRVVKRIDVATGEETRLLDLPFASSIALSPDEKTLYSIEATSHVTRHVITNFASRPRP